MAHFSQRGSQNGYYDVTDSGMNDFDSADEHQPQQEYSSVSSSGWPRDSQPGVSDQQESLNMAALHLLPPLSPPRMVSSESLQLQHSRDQHFKQDPHNQLEDMHASFLHVCVVQAFNLEDRQQNGASSAAEPIFCRLRLLSGSSTRTSIQKHRTTHFAACM
jgi:hypothetical protein